MSDFDWDAYKEAQAEELVIPPVTITLLERVENPDAAGLKAPFVKVMDQLQEAQWPTVQLAYSRVRISDEFYEGDSARKPGQEQPDHKRGDLKKAAHEVEHWWLLGVYPQLFLGFRAHWIEKPPTARGARSFGWQEAVCADPIGVPVENFVDYSVGASKKRQAKDEPGWAHAERVARMEKSAKDMDEKYNDGSSRLDYRPTFKTYRDFAIWLDEALEMSSRVKAAA